MIPVKISIATVSPRRLIGRPLWWVSDQVWRVLPQDRLNLAGRINRLGSRPIADADWSTPIATYAGPPDTPQCPTCGAWRPDPDWPACQTCGHEFAAAGDDTRGV